MALLSDSGAPEAELDRLIDSITANLRPYIRSAVKRMAAKNPENARILCDFIVAEQNEANIKDSTREWKIKVLVWLSQFYEHQKSYKDMTKQARAKVVNKIDGNLARRPTGTNSHVDGSGG